MDCESVGVALRRRWVGGLGSTQQSVAGIEFVAHRVGTPVSYLSRRSARPRFQAKMDANWCPAAAIYTISRYLPFCHPSRIQSIVRSDVTSIG